MGWAQLGNPRFQISSVSVALLCSCRFVVPPSSRMMRRIVSHGRRDFSTAADAAVPTEKIVVSVLFERLPVVVPKIDPVVYAFQEFSFGWQQQYRRRYPDEFLNKSNTRSLNRALDRRLYLLLYGNAYWASFDKPVWHFPKEVYDSEEKLRKGDLSNTYFVGNAPMGHMTIEKREDVPYSASFKDQFKIQLTWYLHSMASSGIPRRDQFFFKSQVSAKEEFNVGKCKDFAWFTKEDLLEYFPDQAQFLNKMIIS